MRSGHGSSVPSSLAKRKFFAGPEMKSFIYRAEVCQGD
jgi:hypothetical protein